MPGFKIVVWFANLWILSFFLDSVFCQDRPNVDFGDGISPVADLNDACDRDRSTGKTADTFYVDNPGGCQNNHQMTWNNMKASAKNGKAQGVGIAIVNFLGNVVESSKNLIDLSCDYTSQILYSCQLCVEGKYHVNSALKTVNQYDEQRCTHCPAFSRKLDASVIGNYAIITDEDGKIKDGFVTQEMFDGGSFTGCTTECQLQNSEGKCSNAILDVADADSGQWCKRCENGETRFDDKSVNIGSRQTESFRTNLPVDVDEVTTDKNIRDFPEISYCMKCPLGMIGVNDIDRWNGELENYWNSDTPLQNAMREDPCEFICTTCAFNDGIPTVLIPEISSTKVCSLCPEGKYQNYAIKDIVVPHYISLKFNREPPSLTLPVGCVYCDQGFEFRDNGQDNICFQLPSFAYKHCCKICQPNFFNAGADTLNEPLTCQKAEGTMVTNSFFGATHVINCNQAGQKIIHCPQNGVCSDFLPMYSMDSAWKTCKSCDDIEDKTENCKKCFDVNANFDRQTEIWDTTKKTCVKCNTCTTLAIKRGSESLRLTIDPGKTNEELILDWSFYLDSYFTGSFQNTISATCRKLNRQGVTRTDNGTWILDDEKDQYAKRTTHQDRFYAHLEFSITVATEVLESDYAHTAFGDPDNEDVEQCGLKECSTVCESFYEFSDGCNLRNRKLYTYVKAYPFGTMLLDDVNENSIYQSISSWKLVTEGVCKSCTPCTSGSFNGNCNEYFDGGRGDGSCSPCTTSCDLNHYMYHEDGEKDRSLAPPLVMVIFTSPVG